MGRIAPYEKLVGDMGVSRLEQAADHVRLVWTCRHQTADIQRHMVEHVLVSWLLYARWIADSELSPREVWFSSTHNRLTPAWTSTRPYSVARCVSSKP